MLLTALTVIGVLGLYRIESRASSFSRRETHAAVLAQDKLEELRTQIAPSADVTGSDAPPDQFSQTSTPFFARDWTIAVSLDTAVYNITVNVTWTQDGHSCVITAPSRWITALPL